MAWRRRRRSRHYQLLDSVPRKLLGVKTLLGPNYTEQVGIKVARGQRAGQVTEAAPASPATTGLPEPTGPAPRSARVGPPTWTQLPGSLGIPRNDPPHGGLTSPCLASHTPQPWNQGDTNASCTLYLLLASSTSDFSFPISICSWARSRAVSSSTLRASASSDSYSILMPLTWGDSEGQVRKVRPETQLLLTPEASRPAQPHQPWATPGSLTCPCHLLPAR